jgi:hypothetical protein
MEPLTAAGVTETAKVAGMVKDWPLWLFFALALSLTVFMGVPAFRNLVPDEKQPFLWFAVIAAWIFVLMRGITAYAAIRGTKTQREARRHFVITAIEAQCFWGVSKQTDGSLVTQISGHFMIKNRSSGKLHLMSGRLVKPKIKGEVLPGLLVTRNPGQNLYGTAHVSGNFIPAGEALPASWTYLVRGGPKQRSGPMRAVIEFSDADGHRETVAVMLRGIPQGKPL